MDRWHEPTISSARGHLGALLGRALLVLVVLLLAAQDVERIGERHIDSRAVGLPDLDRVGGRLVDRLLIGLMPASRRA